MLCECWESVNILADPSFSSDSSSIHKLWSQAPQLRQGLPAMAALLHWLLQHHNTSNTMQPNVHFVVFLVQQLQLLVEDAAEAAVAAGVDQPLTRRQQQLQNKKLMKLAGKQAQTQTQTQRQQGGGPSEKPQGNPGGASPASKRQQVWEAWLPAALKPQVRVVPSTHCKVYRGAPAHLQLLH
jgi:hypothetical protein